MELEPVTVGTTAVVVLEFCADPTTLQVSYYVDN